MDGITQHVADFAALFITLSGGVFSFIPMCPSTKQNDILMCMLTELCDTLVLA